MKEIRIVLAHDLYSDYDEMSQTVMSQGVTDWETISDADLVFLKTHWRKLEADMLKNQNGVRLILLEKDSQSVQVRIDSIKTWIEQDKQRLQREAAERKAKADAKAHARMLKQAESELALLEKLKAKYPEA